MVVEDGKYIGEIGWYVYGLEKVVVICELVKECGYDFVGSFVYFDLVMDVLMFEVVGYLFVVNVDRVLCKVVVECEWLMLMFAIVVLLCECILGFCL